MHQNLEIINNKSSENRPAGGVYLQDINNVIFENSNFENNFGALGSAVYCEANCTLLKFDNCTFLNNSNGAFGIKNSDKITL